jgi:peptidoglycan hydrolase CwlO-like protein
MPLLAAIFVVTIVAIIFVLPMEKTSADTSSTDNSDLQDSIDKLEKKLQDAQDAKSKLEKQLTNINYSVSQTKKDIDLTQQYIKQAEDEIARKERELLAQNDKIDLQHQMLANLLREEYYNQQTSDPVIILTEQNFSSLFSRADNLNTVEQKISDLINQIKSMQSITAQAKGDLENVQQQKQQLLAIKQKQEQGLLGNQADTQQSIEDKQTTINRLNNELSQLQGDLATVTGKSYNAKNIKDAVNFASDQTGVPVGFLIGVLKVETNLGANVGTGTYKKDMNPSQRSTFESICKSLGYNPSKQPVSRRVCYNKKAKDGCGGWGGAMGAAQFIPTTWTGYESSVTSITGHKNPDPWNLTDAVVAMASKLKKTSGVTSGKRSAFKSAACSYLGACNTNYINNVLYWADNYKDLL